MTNQQTCNKIKCAICNTLITASAFSTHLKFKHNLTSQEYYDRYLLKDYQLKFCPICGRENKYKGITLGYSKHCSCKCSAVDENTKVHRDMTNRERYGENYTDVFQQHFVETFIEKYGVENPGQVKQFRDKAKQTSLERYGVEHNWSSKDPKLNGKATVIKKYGSLDKFIQYVTNKSKATVLEKYGVENVFQSEEVKEKIKHTNLARYNVEYSMQSKDVQNRAKQTSLEHYGVEFPSQSEEVKNKIKQTCLKKYGVESYLQSDTCREQLHQYSLDTFGTDYISQSDYFKNFMHDMYQAYTDDDWKRVAEKRSITRGLIEPIDGISFDSSWEVKVYLFAKEHGYDIERSVALKYYIGDIEKTTLIDFKINNRLVEVKANHLLDGCFDAQNIEYKLNAYKQYDVLLITQNIQKYLNDEKFDNIEFMDIDDLKEIN